MSMARVYDAVVVGSGPTGGYAAKVLSEAGMDVLVLEAGRSRRRGNALLSYDALRRKCGYKIEEDPAAIRRQRIQSSCYAWPTHPHAFVDDIEQPYATEPDKPFAWIRSQQLGGRMLVRKHGLQFYRFSDADFKAGDRDGATPAWPICYADLVPYYERIERWLGVSGSVDHIAQLPDSLIAHDLTPNTGERLLQSAIEPKWKDRHLIKGRTAPPPAPILEALATRRCTLRTDAIASHVLVDPDTAKANGVAFVDRWTHRHREALARVVVLCASSIESARILLASATRQHPEGLANSSGVLGRYLMDHTHLTGIHGTLKLSEPIESASWSYIPCFRNIGTKDGRFVRGYGMQVFTMWRECAMTAFGEMLPHRDNRVTLNREKTDKWGIPVAQIRCSHGDNEHAMAKDQVDTCVEMLEAANVEIAGINTELSVPGLAAHEVGTARMGSDPRSSVLTNFCQAWDVKNLFVMDGSSFVTQATQNPTLTMLALAARSCDYLIDTVKRGEL